MDLCTDENLGNHIRDSALGFLCVISNMKIISLKKDTGMLIVFGYLYGRIGMDLVCLGFKDVLLDSNKVLI